MTKKELNEDSLSELKEQKRLLDIEIKKQSRLEAELELQICVKAFQDNDNADTREKLRSACYRYVATHRIIA